VASLAALAVICGVGVLNAVTVQSDAGARHVASELLEGATFGLVIPLFAFALGARVDTGREALFRVAWIRHGGARRPFALGSLVWTFGITSLLAVCGVVLSLGVARASAAPHLVFAVRLGPSWLMLAAGSLLAAASYTACLSLAEVLGGAAARAVFLLGDWLLGSGVGFAALPWPRAHLRALLGGAHVLELSRAYSGVWLLVLSLGCVLLYVRRLPR
jgi:hypothetical protein